MSQNKNLFIDIRFLAIKNIFFNTKHYDFEEMRLISAEKPNFKDSKYSNIIVDDIEYYDLLWEVNKENLSKNRENFFPYFYSCSITKEAFLCKTGFYLTENNFEVLFQTIPEFHKFYNENNLDLFEKKINIHTGFNSYILKREYFEKLISFSRLKSLDDNLIEFHKYLLNKDIKLIIQRIC